MKTSFLVWALSSTAFCVQGLAQRADPPESVIQLRLARQTPAAGFIRMRLAAADTIFYVDERVLITDKDIEEAKPVRGPLNQLVLDIRVTPEAFARFNELASAHIGSRLAVFLDGQFTDAPVVVGPFSKDRTDRRFQIGVPPALEDRVAAAVRARW